ncbi:MAG TPA: hypothetical protein DCZ94_10815 [Lentisphaeria bacterium]|nr:hypothetical protein [Lentisphaeria bacterium]
MWLGIAFFVLMVMLIGFLWWFAASLIDVKPFDIPMRLPDMKAQASATAKFNFTDKLASALAGDSTGCKTGKDETIELTEDEVNALIITGISEQAIIGQGEQELRDAFFKNGIFTIMLSKKIGFSTPFGEYVNISVSFIPGIQNRHLFVIPKGFSLGSLSLPESMIQGRISDDLAAAEQTEYGEALLEIISEMKVEDGKFRITYSPDKLFQFMMDNGLGKAGGGLLGGGLLNMPADE